MTVPLAPTYTHVCVSSQDRLSRRWFVVARRANNELIATPPLGVEIVPLISILARLVHQVPET